MCLSALSLDLHFCLISSKQWSHTFHWACFCVICDDVTSSQSTRSVWNHVFISGSECVTKEKRVMWHNKIVCVSVRRCVCGGQGQGVTTAKITHAQLSAACFFEGVWINRKTQFTLCRVCHSPYFEHKNLFFDIKIVLLFVRKHDLKGDCSIPLVLKMKQFFWFSVSWLFCYLPIVSINH